MKRKLAFISLGLIFIFCFSLCNDSLKKNDESPYLNHSDSANYTGIQSCLPCHSDKYETFIHTGMGMSFDSSSLKKSSADFNNVIPVYDAFKNLYYLPFIRNGIFYLKEYRLIGKDTVSARTEQIDYIVGSGHHTNSHLIEENGYIFQAPITFYTQKGRWDLPPGFENGNNSGFTRKIGMECMSCHNSLPEVDKNADNRYLDLPHGISCERCHGPGEIHVREKKAGNIVDVTKSIDYTIVNPAKLSWQRQIDICQRCHLQGNAVLKPGKSFSDFKPGMVLSETFDQFSPEYSDGEDFVMAAHAERFQKSKCFIANSKGNTEQNNLKPSFTCISCHNPHVSVKQTNVVQFNNTCKSCHSQSNEKLCTEKPDIRAKLDNNCVSCHMPVSGTSDIPHVSVHDHYIRKPDKVKKAVPTQLKGLRCITCEKPDIGTETEAYISYFEKFDANPFYIQKANDLSKKLSSDNLYHLQTLIHLHYINRNYNEIIKLQSGIKTKLDAWSNYRIAKAFENINSLESADQFFIIALEIQSNNLDFILQHAVLQIKMKQWSKAEVSLNKYNSLYSKTAETWAYLGLVKYNAKLLSEAKNHFLKALQLDPDQILALKNLEQIYLLSNPIEAGKITKRIAALSSKK